MSCKIKYNRNGTISSVSDLSGNESTLFKQIANFPFIESKEEALEIYKQTLSTDNEVEPVLKFKADGEIYETYKEALKTGEDIQVGIDSETSFKNLISVPNNQDPNTLQGFINRYISEGLLNENKVEYNGDNFFTTTGENYVEQKVNEDIIKRDLKNTFGTGTFSIKGGLIKTSIDIETENYDSNQKNIVKDLSWY